MFTEYMTGTESLALIINHLSVEMEGKYYCTASYATNEILETSVTVKTYGKLTEKRTKAICLSFAPFVFVFLFLF